MTPTRNNVHSHITQRIIQQIEEGASLAACPWHRDGVAHRPSNAATQSRYRGINILSLWAAAEELGFSSGIWATYRQWQSLGAQVQKGQSGTPIVFYKPIQRSREEGDSDPNAAKQFLLARSSRVFAAEQVDGYQSKPPLTAPFNPLDQVEQLLQATQATVHHRGDRAFYQRSTDRIVMPTQDRFSNQTDYYAVKLHEFVHWTWSATRCNRAVDNYAFEELVAELGAAFLCADLHITLTPREDHAGYLASWLRTLTDDPQALNRAASLASKATDYLLSYSNAT
jgi:antirestriction protein ArdC